MWADWYSSIDDDKAIVCIARFVKTRAPLPFPANSRSLLRHPCLPSVLSPRMLCSCAVLHHDCCHSLVGRQACRLRRGKSLAHSPSLISRRLYYSDVLLRAEKPSHHSYGLCLFIKMGICMPFSIMQWRQSMLVLQMSFWFVVKTCCSIRAQCSHSNVWLHNWMRMDPGI